MYFWKKINKHGWRRFLSDPQLKSDKWFKNVCGLPQNDCQITSPTMNLKTGLALNQHDALNRLKTANTTSTFSFERKSFSPQYPTVISLCTTMWEKSIFNYMKDDSALKTLSWGTDEIKWVTRKIICALILANYPKEITCLKTKRWSWHFREENLVLKSTVESL